jgi:hypothetical protein
MDVRARSWLSSRVARRARRRLPNPTPTVSRFVLDAAGAGSPSALSAPAPDGVAVGPLIGGRHWLPFVWPPESNRDRSHESATTVPPMGAGTFSQRPVEATPRAKITKSFQD